MPAPFSLRRSSLPLGLATLLTLSACGPAAPQPHVSTSAHALLSTLATGTQLRSGTALYPRLVRLQHSGDANGRILASVLAPGGGGQPGQGLIFESTDEGVSFRQVGTVTDPMSSHGSCCSTLYELPRAVGTLPEGTLLWSVSLGADDQNRRMWLPVWRSSDHGRSWSYLSTCASSPNTGGYWEPEFSVAQDGALVCHYSDEGDAAHSQKLMEVRTYDGLHWQDWRPTVMSPAFSDRPGMAGVRQLGDGSYVMSFEVCTPGGQYQCAVSLKTSADGWNWGDPASLGTRPTTADGRYFRATPTLTWAAGGGNKGRLVLVGQQLLNRDGTPAPGNGKTLLVSSGGAAGPWTELSAPVQVPGVRADYCPNYSSALLPVAGGTQVLEVATDYVGGQCQASFARGPLPGALLPLNEFRSLGVTTPGFTNRSLRHFNFLASTEVVDAGSPATLKADATFRIVAGLSDGSCYSFESRNFPGQYLRHQNWRLKLAANDGSSLFQGDATFCARPGLSGSGVSLEARNQAGAFLRHYNAEVWLARSGGPNPSDTPSSFNADASWAVLPAWAP